MVDLKWSVHGKITRLLTIKYGVPKNIADEIVEGSILPDKQPEYYYSGRKRYRVAHHSKMGLDRGISHLKTARKLYKKGNPKWTIHLGMALHYLQDYPVPITRKILKIFSIKDYEMHKKIEEEVERLYVDVDNNVEKAKGKCVRLILKELARAKKGKTPKEVLDLATYYSALAMELVLNPKKCPDSGKILLRGFALRAVTISTALVMFYLAYIGSINPLYFLISLIPPVVIEAVDDDFKYALSEHFLV
ncbi:hypothetical protein [Pyrococcus kukulkanii]|uniref:hypothetical protein n=1 Tax=Pyrococcus kukulkanii TaxID=1609559 RepID=UPI003566C390